MECKCDSATERHRRHTLSEPLLPVHYFERPLLRDTIHLCHHFTHSLHQRPLIATGRRTQKRRKRKDGRYFHSDRIPIVSWPLLPLPNERKERENEKGKCKCHNRLGVSVSDCSTATIASVGIAQVPCHADAPPIAACHSGPSTKRLTNN